MTYPLEINRDLHFTLAKGHTMPKHTPAEKKKNKAAADKKKPQSGKKAFPGAAPPFKKKK